MSYLRYTEVDRLPCSAFSGKNGCRSLESARVRKVYQRSKIVLDIPM